MRIQHNITAMNAYRNYNKNTSAVAKKLEKLSSVYKINRAGDDAAGLAVSEKMRLQISGLAQAQKNAKSGISLVQTAEGALTEVHDMLNRMYTLAEQSANGTFDDSTDRTQLQKEVESLRTEIERIGKTANFNGIGLFAEYAGGGGSSADLAAKVYATNPVGITSATLTYDANITDADKKALNEALKEITVQSSVAPTSACWTGSSTGDVTIGGLPKDYKVTFKDASSTPQDVEVPASGKITTVASAGTSGAGKLAKGNDIELTIKSSDGTALATLKIGKPTGNGTKDSDSKVTFEEATRYSETQGESRRDVNRCWHCFY